MGNLQWLAANTQLPLIQLLDPVEKVVPDTQQTYGSLMSEQGLGAISRYAAGIGPHKQDILGAAHPGTPLSCGCLSVPLPLAASPCSCPAGEKGLVGLESQGMRCLMTLLSWAALCSWSHQSFW